MSVSKLATVLVLSFSLAIVSASAQDQTQSKAQPQSQTSQAPATPAAPPAAKPADVATPDAILAATYDVISGPAGKRDWDRFRSLFLPGARLGAVVKGKDGSLSAKTFTPEEYITFGDVYFMKNGFFEREASRHADRYANIMQIFSTYESRHDIKDPAPFARGINSFQLFFDGKRWWVVDIFWQEETPDAPIPEEFLPKAH
jgi:hypothetical protein